MQFYDVIFNLMLINLNRMPRTDAPDKHTHTLLAHEKSKDFL